MKRAWFGGGLMVALLVLAVALYLLPGRVNGEIAQQMRSAAEYAEKEDWENARAVSGGCEERFFRLRKFSAAFADHAPLEQMEALFLQLRIYEKQKNAVSYAAAAVELSVLAEEVAESFSLHWWTFL